MSDEMNDAKLMLSIVMTAYNHEKYVEKAIKSVIMQKVNFAYEVLIGEDCSTDNTRYVLKNIEKNLPSNFHVLYRKKNMGSGKNGKDLYKRTKGKYVISLECDDYWIYEFKLQRQIDFLESHPEYIAVAHNVIIIDKVGNRKNDFIYPECKSKNYTLQEYKRGILAGQTASLMYRNYYVNKIISEIPVSVNYPGDQRTNFLLPCYGQVRCFQEKWSAYRLVTDEGTSYMATFKDDADFARRRLIFHRTLYEYAQNIVRTEESIKVSESMYIYYLLKDVYEKSSKNSTLIKWLKDYMGAQYKINVINYVLYRIMKKIIRKIRT